MVVKQISAIINNLANQYLGLSDLTSTDASAVTIGKKLLSSDDTDAFYKSLNDVIGRTVFENEPYFSTLDLWREPMEYGGAIRSLYVQNKAASNNAAWTGIGSDATDYDAFKPAATDIIQQTIWNTVGVWDYDQTVPDYQVNSAFTSWEGVAALYDALFIATENDMMRSLEITEIMCRGAMIAQCIQEGYAVDLLEMYNTENPTAKLTQASCQVSPEFLRYCAQTIPVLSDMLERQSGKYNILKRTTHTSRANQRLVLLSTFARAFDVYLQSSTFHDNLTGLGSYTVAPFWQSAGKSIVPTFGQISSINLTGIPKANGETGTNSVAYNGIIGVLYDAKAMGITMDQRKSDALHNPKKDFTNYFHKAKRGMYNNLGRNCIVLTVNGGSTIADEKSALNVTGNGTETE